MIDPVAPSAGLPRPALGVAALVHAVADSLASRFGAVSVRGEVSGWSRAASGHCYFTLKDADGQDAMLRCALFRRAAAWLDFTPRNGLLVTLRGRLALYEPRGELQFVAESMLPAGAGALHEQFLRLKALLEAEGLFDAARKRPLPAFPRRVGIVSSLGAAALHDVVSSLSRRAPHVEAIVYPSLVQGPDAPLSLLAALELAQRRSEVDVLLLCRGGGSLEDLWAFNDERVVRAVARCTLPLICGVGHETDVSLCDFAADLRAPTPTAAAELAVPATLDCARRLDALGERLRRSARQHLDTRAQRLDRLSLRMARPSEWLHRAQRRVDQLAARLVGAARQRREFQQHRLPQLAQRLHRALTGDLALRRSRLERLGTAHASLDPARVLQRGYAWLSDTDGQPVTTIARLSTGDVLDAMLSDGRAGVVVRSLTPHAAPVDGLPAAGDA